MRGSKDQWICPAFCLKQKIQLIINKISATIFVSNCCPKRLRNYLAFRKISLKDNETVKKMISCFIISPIKYILCSKKLFPEKTRLLVSGRSSECTGALTLKHHKGKLWVSFCFFPTFEESEEYLCSGWFIFYSEQFHKQYWLSEGIDPCSYKKSCLILDLSRNFMFKKIYYASSNEIMRKKCKPNLI